MTDKDAEELRRLGIRDRRKNTYEVLEKKVDDHIDENRELLQRWIKRGLIAFGIIGLACTIALIGFGIVLAEQRETSKNLKETSDQLKIVVAQNEALSRDIQDQRGESVMNDCLSTNKRNQDTSDQLTALAKQDADAQPTQAGKLEVRRRRDVTLALIDLLQPVQDCAYEVALTLGQVTPTPTPSPTPTP